MQPNNADNGDTSEIISLGITIMVQEVEAYKNPTLNINITKTFFFVDKERL